MATWVAFASARSRGATEWLRTPGIFGKIDRLFREVHPNHDYRFELVEAERDRAKSFEMEELEFPEVVAEIEVYVERENHAKEAVNDLSRAIEAAGGTLAEFNIGTHRKRFVA